MEILLVIVLCCVFALSGYHFFFKKQKTSEAVKEYLPVENPEVEIPTTPKKQSRRKVKQNKK